MTKLAELASLVRSKNAGPLVLTFDVLFDDRDKYMRVKRSGVLNPESFAAPYRCSPNMVRFFSRPTSVMPTNTADSRMLRWWRSRSLNSGGFERASRRHIKYHRNCPPSTGRIHPFRPADHALAPEQQPWYELGSGGIVLSGFADTDVELSTVGASMYSQR
jgi:Domain of unknown function (DUF4387)